MTARGHSPAVLAPRVAGRLGAVVLCGLAWAASSGGTAHAQAQASSQTGAAEALFRQAVGLAKRGKYADAIPKFQASYELDPARGTLLGWAMAEERVAKLAGALAHYQQLRDEAHAAGDERREKTATQRIAQLLPRVPTLTITTAQPLPEGTKLELNGRNLPAGALGSQLPLDPGKYVLLVEGKDGSRFERTVHLGEGARENLEIRLESASGPTRPGEEGTAATEGGVESGTPADSTGSSWTVMQTTGVVVGALGLVGLGIGGYLWYDSGKTYDSVSSACDDGVCPPDQADAINEGRSRENTARWAFVLGGIAVTAGVTLVVIGTGQRQQTSEKPPSISLALAPASVQLRGSF